MVSLSLTVINSFQGLFLFTKIYFHKAERKIMVTKLMHFYVRSHSLVPLVLFLIVWNQPSCLIFVIFHLISKVFVLCVKRLFFVKVIHAFVMSFWLFLICIIFNDKNLWVFHNEENNGHSFMTLDVIKARMKTGSIIIKDKI